MKIEIVPFKEEYMDAVIELTYIAWQPIFDHYLETLGEKCLTTYMVIGNRQNIDAFLTE